MTGGLSFDLQQTGTNVTGEMRVEIFTARGGAIVGSVSGNKFTCQIAGLDGTGELTVQGDRMEGRGPGGAWQTVTRRR